MEGASMRPKGKLHLVSERAEARYLCSRYRASDSPQRFPARKARQTLRSLLLAVTRFLHPLALWRFTKVHALRVERTTMSLRTNPEILTSGHEQRAVFVCCHVATCECCTNERATS